MHAKQRRQKTLILALTIQSTNHREDNLPAPFKHKSCVPPSDSRSPLTVQHSHPELPSLWSAGGDNHLAVSCVLSPGCLPRRETQPISLRNNKQQRSPLMIRAYFGRIITGLTLIPLGNHNNGGLLRSSLRSGHKKRKKEKKG